MIRLENCDVRLGDSYLLHDLSVSIDSGDTCVLVGANGAGKSALIAAFSGEGSTVRGARRNGARKVSIVSLEEQSQLIAREKARDDSDLTDKVNPGTPVQEMLDEVCVDEALQLELIEALGLSPLLERGFRKLSTGETRKVLLVRALTSGADLLLLDEPFEGLDVDSVPRVKAIFSRLYGSVTTVLVLNRMDQVPDQTTQVVQVEQASIAKVFRCESGEARRLLSQIDRIQSADLSLPPPEYRLKAPLNEDGSLVRLNRGRVAYTDNVVFEGLDWVIHPGEHWQVRGPNGSGKTCLLNLVTGDHPQCYVNDLSLFGFKRGQGETIWQIKQFLGFVSTGLHWDYRLSVGVRNVIVSGFYDSIGLYQKATENELQIADAWLQLLGLENRAGDSFASLSYGEQRVVLIARAMVKHPPILLLDEPCLGLDDANRQLVLCLIQRICDEGATTLVYVTHHEEDRIPQISNELRLG